MASKSIKKTSGNSAETDEAAERSNYNVFKRLGTKIRGFRDLEIKAVKSQKPDAATPKLPAGKYRCYVLESDSVNVEKILLKKIITLSLPVLMGSQFNTDKDCNLIGYDTEYEEIKDESESEPIDWLTETLEIKHPRFKMLSHQFWFNLGGVRFGVVYLTDKRFTQRQFVELLGSVVQAQKVQKNKKPDRKRLGFVYSYFSLIESGWMHLGKPDMKLKKQYPNERVAKAFDVRTEDEPNKDTTKRPRAVIKEKGREWEGDSEIHKGVSSLLFADAGNYVRGGLSKLGEEIGIRKIEITQEHIEKMSAFRDASLDDFIEYGINDSVIAAEAHNFYKNTTREVVSEVLADVLPNSTLDLDATKTRITGYSAHVFRAIYKELFGKNWKQLLGYEKVGRRVVQTIMHKAFTKYYYGGRNDVFEVGPRGNANYFDLHSAYPTAVVMMGDYDFSRHTHWCAEGAEVRVEELMKEDNPFLPFGVTLSFIFHEKITKADGTVQQVYPIFPCRIDDSEAMPGVKNAGGCDGLIYPRTGVSNVTWPEYWVAVKSGLLKKHTVLELITFEPVTEENDGQIVQTFKLSRVMQKLLEVRAAGTGATKSYIKALTNYFYGLSASSIADAAKVIKKHDEGIKMKASGVSSYPLAAYITGFCRAVVGELLQQNHGGGGRERTDSSTSPCYAITTDGFITPHNSLQHGELCLRVGAKLHLKDENGDDKPFINLEKSGNRSIFTKTRGYLLLQDDVPTKIAAQGAQVRDNGKHTEASVEKLLEQLQRGWADKLYWPELAEVRKIQVKDPDFVPYKMCRKDSKIDMTFDFKHKPVIDLEKKDEHWVVFNYKGKDYHLMSFKTIPLETVHDFHVIRTLSKRRDYMRKYRDDLKGWCDKLNALCEQADLFKKEKDFECIVDAELEAKLHKPWMDWEDYVALMTEYAKYEEGRQYKPEPADFSGDEEFDEMED